MRASQSNPGPAADDTNMCLSDEQTTSRVLFTAQEMEVKGCVCLTSVIRIKLLTQEMENVRPLFGL